MFTKTIRLLILVLPACCLLTCPIGAQHPATLAIMPLAVYAEQDMTYLANGATEMLASRIAAGSGIVVMDTGMVKTALAEAGQTPDQAAIRSMGRSLKADYVLSGSITRLGDRFSLDITVLPVDRNTSTASFFQQADNIDGVIPAVNIIAEKINRQIFAVAPEEPVTKAASGVPAIVPVAVAKPPDSSKDFKKILDLPVEARGLAAADLDGDGKTEIVIVSSYAIDVRRMEKDRLSKIAEYQAAPNQRLLTVDAVDTDADGRAEIFVTGLKNTSQRLCSFVLVLSEKGLETVSQKLNWYFRSPTAGLLAGQKKGLSELFLPRIWRLEKTGADYIETEPIAVPDRFSVFSFCPGDADNDGDTDMVVLDNDDRLRLYDNEKELLWKSNAYFGGSETRLTDKKNAADTESCVYLPQRIIVSDINRDGRNEVLTVSNSAVGGRVFQHFRRYSRASFICLAWDGLGLSELWQTSPVSGYVADFALADIDNDGENELAALIVSSRDSLLSKPKSAVIVYDINGQI